MLNLFSNINYDVNFCHFLIYAVLLFVLGITIMVTSGNLVKILIGAGFMFNAAILTFAASNGFITNENAILNTVSGDTGTLISTFAPLENIGQTFSIPMGQATGVLITFLGAIEIVICFGLIYCVYSKYKSASTDTLCALKADECKKEGEF